MLLGYISFPLYVMASGSHPKWVGIKSCCMMSPSILHMKQMEGPVPAYLQPQPSAFACDTESPEGSWGACSHHLPTKDLCIPSEESCTHRVYGNRSSRRGCTTPLHCTPASGKGFRKETQKHTSGWMGLHAAMWKAAFPLTSASNPINYTSH